MSEVIVPADCGLPGQALGSQPKTWLTPLCSSFSSGLTGALKPRCWPPPDERALKGMYSLEGAQGLRPGVVWKADSGGDLSWYPHYTGTEGTLYLQSATI